MAEKKMPDENRQKKPRLSILARAISMFRRPDAEIIADLEKKIRDSNLKKQRYKQDAEAAQSRVRQFEAFEELQTFILSVVDLCKSNKRILEDYAGETEAAEILARADGSPSESREDFMFKEVLRVTIENAKHFEARVQGALMKAHSKEDTANDKYNKLMDCLAKIVPDTVADARCRIDYADSLKDADNKGEKPEEEKESYKDIFSDTILAAITQRKLIQRLYQGLLEHFPDEKEFLSSLVTNASDSEGKVAAYALDKLLQQKNRIADYGHENQKHAPALSNMPQYLIGKELDKTRLRKEPVPYLVEVITSLKEEADQAGYSLALSPADPVELVQQAYLHGILSDSYSQEGEEKLAKEQLKKAESLCQTALDLAPEESKESIKAEIQKFKDYFAEAKDG
ncbi:hypothetical protein GF343_03445 [Candidatus Woesearchaeota archaeon]|nr:hypothetical protein [Candidatus Woesearchaeota archaeon]